MPTIFTTFETNSGHLPHFAKPVSEYPGSHSAHKMPVFPSAQSPWELLCLGGSQPKHTSILGHLIKFVEFSDLLQ